MSDFIDENLKWIPLEKNEYISFTLDSANTVEIRITETYINSIACCQVLTDCYCELGVNVISDQKAKNRFNIKLFGEGNHMPAVVELNGKQWIKKNFQKKEIESTSFQFYKDKC